MIIITVLTLASCRRVDKENSVTSAAEQTSREDFISMTDSIGETTESETYQTQTQETETRVTETEAPVTEPPSTTKAPTTTAAPTTVPTTTKAVVTTTKIVTTTAKAVTTAVKETVTKKTESFDKSLATRTVEKTYFADLKYGVDRRRRVRIYYAQDANGREYKLGEEEISVFYDRSTYSASYNDLLPAARENRSTYKDYISEVLRLTNEMRAEGGIAPLTLDDKLTEQANVRAEEIAWSGLHSHTRPNTRSYSSLFIDNGYKTGTSGENIGWYQKTPAEVCRQWKESPTHYENIMNPVFTRIGIGVAAEADPSKGLCWVQHFYGA